MTINPQPPVSASNLANDSGRRKFPLRQFWFCARGKRLSTPAVSSTVISRYLSTYTYRCCTEPGTGDILILENELERITIYEDYSVYN